ncbi:MAG: winged helix-turn-helix domain-containing protein [Syntrophobacteraceae bacterium]|nr:winged helix-turn-helix domain-containing protein [Syntrophobacteraceae bacterium]
MPPERAENFLKSLRLHRGVLGSIEQDEFVDVIIALLYASGGQARRQKVLDRILNLFKPQFREADYECLASQNPPKERWIHNVDWAKRKLVEKRLLLRPGQSPYGTWVLTETGKTKAQILLAASQR